MFEADVGGGEHVCSKLTPGCHTGYSKYNNGLKFFGVSQSQLS